MAKAHRRDARHTAVGAVHTFRVADGRYGACQVTADGETDDQIEVVVLDYLEDAPPSAARAAGLAALRLDWNGGGPARFFVDRRAPWWLEDVTTAPPRARFTGACSRFARWTAVHAAYDHARWRARGDEVAITRSTRAERVIDLRDTDADTLTLEVGEHDAVVRVPACLASLTVIGPASRLTVEGARADFPFALAIVSPRIAPPPRGLEDVEDVEYAGLVDTDTAGLVAYTRLARLVLRGAPGRLQDASGLAHVARTLHELEIEQLYALDGARWPTTWPRLDGAAVRGLARGDAVAIKAALASVPEVRVTGARSDAWIADTLDNPFRAWDEDGASFGRRACAAWKTAKARADALGPAAAPDDAAAVLRGLVDALRALAARHPLDTLRREEAIAAVFALASSMGVAAADAEAWLEESQAMFPASSHGSAGPHRTSRA